MNLKTFCFAESKAEHIDLVYKMLCDSYVNVSGGMFYSKEEFISKEYVVWLIAVEKEVFKSIVVYKNTPIGKKIILGGTDGTRKGKSLLYKMLSYCLSNTEKNFYIEASGCIEHWCDKLSLSPIPHNNDVSHIMLKPQSSFCYDSDGYHYTREIKGLSKRKVLFGNPKV